MSILVNKNTKLVVQGITGREGLFHTEQMLAYGTNVVAGVTPGKGGQWVANDKIPVFDSVKSPKMPRGLIPASSLFPHASRQTPCSKRPMLASN